MATLGKSNQILHVILIGGLVLLLIDLYYLLYSLLTGDYVPMLPVIGGIFTAGGLMLIVRAEQQSEEENKRAHRRIARVAQQLINPLQTLQDDLSELQASKDKLSGAQRLQLKKMSTKARVVLDNVRDVFLALQAQEGRIAQEVRVYDVGDLVKEAQERMQPLASARNVALQVKVHCSNARVRLDKRLFMVALQHVIENGIYYTLTPGLVKVDVVKGKKLVRVVVQDRGIGVGRKDAAAVWQPFARGEEADRYDPDGIGVGLALSRLIMSEFGGSVNYVKKTRGLGTQFEICLPLSR